MRGAAAGVVVAAALLLAVGAGPAASASGPADPTVGPLIAGTGSYVGGTYAWTDYVYDDRGPDSDDEAGGDAGYERSPGNLADLVQVQLAATADGWRLGAVLQTLLAADVPLVGVGVDLDADPSTGAATVPGGRWRVAGPLGIERMVLLSAAGAEVLVHRDGAWETAGTAPASVDPDANLITAEVPAALLPLRGDRARMVAVAGVAGARSWAAGDGPILDLAFHADEPPRGWQDEGQAAVLAGDRPSADAVAVVDLAAVRAGTTRTATATAAGFHTRLYRSHLTLGEGIRTLTLTGPGGAALPVGDHYAGPYQPYLVRIGDEVGPDPPLVVYLHGLGGTHLDSSAAFAPGGGFDPPGVVVFPLGRGGNTFYIGSGEQDVLDVIADAGRAYGVDPARVTLAGVSMGGFGTFRLGVRYPDRFATLLPIIGTGASAQSTFEPVPPAVLDALFPPAGFPGGSAELLDNVRALPVRMVNGQVDPIVNAGFPERDAVELQRLGYDHRYWVLERRQHEVVPALVDCVMVAATERRRSADPPRVTYAVEPATFIVDDERGLDLRYDGAYWVSGITAREDVDEAGEQAVVDATSLARSDRDPVVREVLGAGENLTAGRDLCGPDPDVRTGDVWRVRGLAHEPGSPAPTRNALAVSLARTAAAGFDLDRAGLSADVPVTIEVSGDGPATLRLTAPWPGAVAVELDGEDRGTVEPVGGTVTLAADLAGAHTYVLRPAPAPHGVGPGGATGPDPGGAAAPALPATGGGAALAAAAVLAAGLLRRR